MIMRTDEAFCGGGGGLVRRIMERRRRHGECKRGGVRGGCEVIVGGSCGGGRGRGVGRLLRGRVGWGVAVWVVGVLVCWVVKWAVSGMH